MKRLQQRPRSSTARERARIQMMMHLSRRRKGKSILVMMRQTHGLRVKNTKRVKMERYREFKEKKQCVKHKLKILNR